MKKGAVVLLSGGLDSSVLLHRVARRVVPDKLYAMSFHYGQRHQRELEMARCQMAEIEIPGGHVVQDISFYGELLNGSSALIPGGPDVPSRDSITAAEKNQPVTYVPNRNMVLLSLAAAFAEANGCSTVYYGAHQQDDYSYWDCTQSFVERMNAVLQLNRRQPVGVEAPFVRLAKAEIVLEGVRLGVDFSNTWSCYEGQQYPCGLCPTCAERGRAFADAGVVDPIAAQDSGQR